MRTRIFTWLFMLLMPALCWANEEPPTETIDGKTFYLLDSKEDLEWFRDYVNDGNADACAKLTADIDLNPGFTFDANGYSGGSGTPEEWKPSSFESFRGIIDGNGHEIKGLYIKDTDDDSEYLGLFERFGSDNSSTDILIQNLGVTNSYIEGKNSYIGGITAVLGKNACINNCYFEGNIILNGSGGAEIRGLSAAGIAGTGVTGGKIIHCYNEGNIKVSINDLTGSVSGLMLPLVPIYINGIGGGSDISNCYNSGNIDVTLNEIVEGSGNSGNLYMIGIGGIGMASNIESSYNIGKITVQGKDNKAIIGIGGIQGLGGSSMKYTYNTGIIESAVTNINPNNISKSYGVGSILGLASGAVSFSDNYYLPQEDVSSVGGNYMDPSASYDDEEGLISATSIQFSSGEVAYLLCEYGYGQNLQNESITSPTLLAFTPNTEVYKLTLNYGDVDSEKEEEEIYVNSGYLGLPELTTEEEGKRIGWFDASGTEYTSESEITEDISLTAKVVDQTEEPTDPDEGDEDDDNPGDIHHPQRPIKYYNIYVDTVCPGLDVEVSKNVVREGHQVSAYLTIQAECDTTGMRFEYKRSLFGYWQDLKELEGVQPGEYIIKNIYTDIYIRALDATLPEEEPTGIEDVEGVKAYAKEGNIYIYTPNREEVTIISMGGAILKHAEQIGLQSYRVSRGIYIVRVGEKVFKLKN